jgi:hypothetical protein
MAIIILSGLMRRIRGGTMMVEMLSIKILSTNPF